MFIGSFWHAPNEDAMCYFVEDVLPIIRRALPDVPVFIIGSHMPQRIRSLSSGSTRAIGYVQDPAEYFARCRVFVSPLRYGAGMKGKIGHSLSHGLPVVTSSIGAEGMMLVDGEHALIADGAQAFANAVVRLYTDRALWDRIREQGRNHIARHFSRDTAKVRLERLFPQPEASLVQ
jgi:glycosyltransferase involved in cell wall biosynthesis